MKGHGPIIANAKLAASEQWQEPVRDGALKHRRFIWATQFGVGSSGAGAQGRKAKASRLLQRALAERVGVNALTSTRQAEQRKAKLTPPRVIQGLLGASV